MTKSFIVSLPFHPTASSPSYWPSPQSYCRRSSWRRRSRPGSGGSPVGGASGPSGGQPRGAATRPSRPSGSGYSGHRAPHWQGRGQVRSGRRYESSHQSREWGGGHVRAPLTRAMSSEGSGPRARHIDKRAEWQRHDTAVTANISGLEAER